MTNKFDMNGFIQRTKQQRRTLQFDEFEYGGKRFVDRDIHCFRNYKKDNPDSDNWSEKGYNFRCPHCNTHHALIHDEPKICEGCNKILYAVGGAFYYELD